MKHLFLLVLIAAVSAATTLQYGDYWGSGYSSAFERGEWFDVTGFVPGATGFHVDQIDMLVFGTHDVPDSLKRVVIDVWSGDAAGPTEHLGGPYICQVDPGDWRMVTIDVGLEGLDVPADFWVIQQPYYFAEVGWPPLAQESSSFPPYHGFYCNPPWMVCENFAIICHGDPLALSQSAWGAIKAGF
jgi:hypothetical protein